MNAPSLSDLVARIERLEQTVDSRLVALEREMAAVRAGDTTAAAPPAAPNRPPGAPEFIEVEQPWRPPAPAAPAPQLDVTGRPATTPPPPATGAVAMPPPPTPARRVASTAGTVSYEVVERPPLDVESVLRWVGVGLVTLAGLFLVSTAITRGWINEEMQLIGAALAGCGLLAGAVHHAETRRDWSHAMGIGGSIVLISSASAAHAWRQMVAPGVALTLVALATVVCLGLGLHNRSNATATTAGLVGLVAPSDYLLDLGDGAGPLWVLAVVAAMHAVGLRRQWTTARLLPSWAGALAAVVFAFLAGDGQVATWAAVVGIIGVAVLLIAGPVVAQHLASPDDAASPARAADLRTTAGVPTFVWLGLLGLGSGDSTLSAGTVGLGVAGFFMAVAAVGWLTVSRPSAVALALGSSAVLAVSLALMLDGPALMVALAVQGLVSFALALHLDDRGLEWSAHLLGAAASVLALWHTVEAIETSGFETAGHAIATFAIGGLWAGAAALGMRTDGLDSPRFTVPFIGAWAGLLLWLLAALVAIPEGLSMVSGAWAVLAGAGIAVGLSRNIDLLRGLGLATLALTLGKLFTVDLAEVDVLVRVVLFFVVGVGLIALGLRVPALISTGQQQGGDEPSEPDQPVTF